MKRRSIYDNDDNVTAHDNVNDWRRFLAEGTLYEAGEDEEEDPATDTGEDDAVTSDDLELDVDAPEDEEPDQEEPGDPGPSAFDDHEETPHDSFDNQIDAYLIKYEKEALHAESRRPRRSRLASVMLFEAPKDDAADGEDSTGVVSNATLDSPVEKANEEFNIDVFSMNVARLITNYDKLMNIPLSIFTRAYRYLEQNYSADIADEFAEIMREQHGIEFVDDANYPEHGPTAVGGAIAPSAEGGGAPDVASPAAAPEI